MVRYQVRRQLSIVYSIGEGLAYSWLYTVEIVRDPALLAVAKEYVFAGLESGQFTPFIDRTFHWIK